MRIAASMIVIAWVGAAWAGDPPAPAPSGDQIKSMSGMAVLGNNEAPKALVLVPWKSSQIGDGIGVVESLSNRPMPVDRDVFARELHYYEIRAGEAPEAGGSDTQGLAVGSR
jgi:hypothetical protein